MNRVKSDLGIIASGIVAGVLAGCTAGEGPQWKALNRDAAVQEVVVELPPAASTPIAPFHMVGEPLGLGLATHLVLRPPLLIAADHLSSPHLVVADFGPGGGIKRAAPHGEGDGEIREPASVDVNGEGEILVYDRPRQRMSWFDSRGGRIRLIRQSELPVAPNRRTRQVFATSGGMALFGHFGTVSYQLLDTVSRSVTSWRVELPVQDADGADSAWQQIRNARTSALNSARTRAVTVYQVAPVVDLHPLRGEGPWRRVRVVKDRPDQRDASTGPTGAVTRHYVDVAANDALIAALYCGCPLEHRSASEVHVFDWSGALLSRISLDREVYRIAVDRSHVLAAAIWESGGVGLWRMPISRASWAER